MATGKRYYWIKLKESFMSSDTVDYLMSKPAGANYVVLYQMLCLKTINTDGKLCRRIGEILIPYDIEKIQRDCKWFSVDTVRIALKVYADLGRIYLDNDGVLVMADHNNLVGSETDYAERNRRLRSEKKALPVHNVYNDVSQNEYTDNRDKDIKILDNRDKEVKSIEIDTSLQAEAEHCPFEKIKDLYHSICKAYPKIISIDGNRKKAIQARWRSYKDIKVFEELFTIAENSDFLKGNNDRNWCADFDWLMKPTNFPKVLEHRYDNKKEDKKELTAFGDNEYDSNSLELLSRGMKGE